MNLKKLAESSRRTELSSSPGKGKTNERKNIKNVKLKLSFVFGAREI